MNIRKNERKKYINIAKVEMLEILFFHAQINDILFFLHGIESIWFALVMLEYCDNDITFTLHKFEKNHFDPVPIGSNSERPLLKQSA